MTYIYLSYAKADRETAFAMRDMLKKEGFHVWMDENQHELSGIYWPNIRQNIRNSGLFVLLVSDIAKDSKWLNRELNYAESIKKPIRAFVIQGEGWERVTNYITPLNLGFRLDVPDDAANQMKSILKASPDNLLPWDIPSDAIGRFTRRLIIAVCLIVSALVLINRFAPMAQEFFQNSLNTPSPAPLTTRQVLEATSAASIQTRAYETENAVEIAQTATAHAIATVQADMNLTAIARGGVLPCEADPIEQSGLSHLKFYYTPNPDDFMVTRRIRDIDYLVLTEWVESYNIIWYRAENENGVDYGYIQAEWLVLDEDCPR